MLSDFKRGFKEVGFYPGWDSIRKQGQFYNQG